MNNFESIAVIAIIVFMVCFFLNKQTKVDTYEANTVGNRNLMRDNQDTHHPNPLDYGLTEKHDKSVIGCKIKKTENTLDDYIWGSLLGRHRVCQAQLPLKKEAETALEEHLRVRDITWQDGHQEDPVDRVNMLYLSDNQDIARSYEGTKIRDLYNQLTRGPTLYNRTCARTPKFDNYVGKEYYDVNGPQEFMMKRKHHNYNKEHSMNGGPIEPTLYGDDPSATSYLPLQKY